MLLVTGGAGFIGSHIVDALVKRGDKVRVFDNLSTGNLNNLKQVNGLIELYEGSVEDTSACEAACKGVKTVFHLAALPSVPRSISNPVGSHQANSTGTLNLLVAARNNGCQRFVYAGSSSAYGRLPGLPKTEQSMVDPVSPYAVSKLAGEFYCRAFSTCYGMETICLRYFNVFGPRQDPKSEYAAVIPKIITSVLNRESPVFYGDGTQSRDFTYVENIVQTNLAAADPLIQAPLDGHHINVAFGQPVSLLEILALTNEILGTDVKPSFLPERCGDIRHSCASPDAVLRLIGEQSAVPFEEGLRRTIEWYRRSFLAASGLPSKP